MLHSDTTAEYAESRHGQRNAFVRVVRNCPYFPVEAHGLQSYYN